MNNKPKVPVSDLPDLQEEAVLPLLARANLLRIRGQWDEAVAVCTDVLQRNPRSANAHSLLGDIYAAQDKREQALQWYAMAVELNPLSRPDRDKLNRLLQEQRGHAETTAELQRAAVLARKSPGVRTAERTLEWFDRCFPPGKGGTLTRLIVAACGVLTILLTGGALYLNVRRTSPTTIVYQPTDSGKSLSNANASDKGNGNVKDSERTTLVTPGDSPDNSKRPTEPGVLSEGSVPGRDMAANKPGVIRPDTHHPDEGIGAALRHIPLQMGSTPSASGNNVDENSQAALIVARSLPATVRLQRFTLDRSNGSAVLDLVYIGADGAGQPPTPTTLNAAGVKDRIVRAAGASAIAVLKGDSGLRQVQVRVLATVGNGPLFSGTMEAATLRPALATATANTPTPTFSDAALLGLFSNVQWGTSDAGNNTSNSPGNRGGGTEGAGNSSTAVPTPTSAGGATTNNDQGQI